MNSERARYISDPEPCPVINTPNSARMHEEYVTEPVGLSQFYQDVRASGSRLRASSKIERGWEARDKILKTMGWACEARELDLSPKKIRSGTGDDMCTWSGVLHASFHALDAVSPSIGILMDILQCISVPPIHLTMGELQMILRNPSLILSCWSKTSPLKESLEILAVRLLQWVASGRVTTPPRRTLSLRTQAKCLLRREPRRPRQCRHQRLLCRSRVPRRNVPSASSIKARPRRLRSTSSSISMNCRGAMRSASSGTRQARRASDNWMQSTAVW